MFPSGTMDGGISHGKRKAMLDNFMKSHLCKIKNKKRQLKNKSQKSNCEQIKCKK